MRQAPVFDPRRQPATPLTTLSYDYAAGHLVPEHFHEQDQLVYAVSGVMSVETSRGVWVVPPQRAVWVPAQTPHAIRMSGAVTMKTLYLAPRVARKLPRRCSVLNVSPLLREVLLRLCEREAYRPRAPKQARLFAILLDELEAAPLAPLALPMPRDPRALRLAEALLEDPADTRTLADLSKSAGGSKRTLERAFRAETAMTFGKWRQQLSMLHAIRLLASGQKVTSVALEAGYSSASAFISMFKRALGTTPGEYFAIPPRHPSVP